MSSFECTINTVLFMIIALEIKQISSGIRTRKHHTNRHFQLNRSLNPIPIKFKANLGGFSSYSAFVQLKKCEFTLPFHLDDPVRLVGPHIFFSLKVFEVGLRH